MRMSLDTLRGHSDAIVVARTVETESFWNDDRTAILTRVTLEVEDALLGEITGRTEVIVPGGQIGKYRHEVSDMPVFISNEESVVFLERHVSGVNVVAGGALGKFEILNEGTSGLKLVKGIGADFELSESDERPQPSIPLEELKNELRRR